LILAFVATLLLSPLLFLALGVAVKLPAVLWLVIIGAYTGVAGLGFALALRRAFDGPFLSLPLYQQKVVAAAVVIGAGGLLLLLGSVVKGTGAAGSWLCG